jgi:SAM-dependent methyltransferase
MNNLALLENPLIKRLKEHLRIRTRLREVRRYLNSHPFSFRTRRQKERVLQDVTLEPEKRVLLRAIESRISHKDTMYNGDGEHYFKIGLSALRAIEEALAAVGKSSVESVLDLPCGHGRVLRTLVQRFPTARFTACDLDRNGVDFCAKVFKAKPVYSKISLDELELGTRFDLIWCGSLITHLDDVKITALFKFFHRQLQRGGLLVFTTQGDRAIERMLRREFNYVIDKENIPVMASRYREYGFGYMDYPDMSGYGITMTSPAWIRAQIERVGGFKEVYFKAHGWDNHQDVFGIIKHDE